jgi:hypothetical protein
MDALDFLADIGPAFGIGFAGLACLTIWEFLRARDEAVAASAVAERVVAGRPGGAPGGSAAEEWRALTEARGALAAAVSRVQVVSTSIQSLALFGTCLGFLDAMMGARDLVASNDDPVGMISALLDGGIATALGATVCGQGLYLVLSQAWVFGFAHGVEVAFSRVDEALSVARDRATGWGAP